MKHTIRPLNFFETIREAYAVLTHNHQDPNRAVLIRWNPKRGQWNVSAVTGGWVHEFGSYYNFSAAIAAKKQAIAELGLNDVYAGTAY